MYEVISKDGFGVKRKMSRLRPDRPPRRFFAFEFCNKSALLMDVWQFLFCLKVFNVVQAVRVKPGGSLTHLYGHETSRTYFRWHTLDVQLRTTSGEKKVGWPYQSTVIADLDFVEHDQRCGHVRQTRQR